MLIADSLALGAAGRGECWQHVRDQHGNIQWGESWVYMAWIPGPEGGLGLHPG